PVNTCEITPAAVVAAPTLCTPMKVSNAPRPAGPVVEPPRVEMLIGTDVADAAELVVSVVLSAAVTPSGRLLIWLKFSTTTGAAWADDSPSDARQATARRCFLMVRFVLSSGLMFATPPRNMGDGMGPSRLRAREAGVGFRPGAARSRL